MKWRIFRHADFQCGIERLTSLRLLTIWSKFDTVSGVFKSGHLARAIYHNLVFVAHKVAGPVGAHRISNQFLVSERSGHRLFPALWLD